MSDYPLLQEMPQDIESIDWHELNDLTKNEELYDELNAIKYKKFIMKAFDKAEIYLDKSTYFCLDHKLERVTYYMTYKVTTFGKIGQCVWQSLVWTNPLASYISGIPQKMFFEQLLPKFNTIMTDSQQTWDGKRFWKLRIVDAFKMGLNVYFYDFSNHNLIKLDVDNHSDLEKFASMKDVWGISDTHKMKRFIISNKALPLTKGS